MPIAGGRPQFGVNPSRELTGTPSALSGDLPRPVPRSRIAPAPGVNTAPVKLGINQRLNTIRAVIDTNVWEMPFTQSCSDELGAES